MVPSGSGCLIQNHFLKKQNIPPFSGHQEYNKTIAIENSFELLVSTFFQSFLFANITAESPHYASEIVTVYVDDV